MTGLMARASTLGTRRARALADAIEAAARDELPDVTIERVEERDGEAIALSPPSVSLYARLSGVIALAKGLGS